MKHELRERAGAFCSMVADRPDVSRAVAHLGSWLLGAAAKLDGFPLEVTISGIRDGFVRNGVKVHGMSGRETSIREALAWMQDNKLISISQGNRTGNGHHTQLISWEI